MFVKVFFYIGPQREHSFPDCALVGYQFRLAIFRDADVNFLQQSGILLIFLFVNFVLFRRVQGHLDVEVAAEVNEVEDVEASENRNSLQNWNRGNDIRLIILLLRPTY